MSHPSIVPIYSVDEREGLVYFVMAYVDGDNLAKRLHDRGPMDVVETRRILREVADALAYAHARNVIHRDIKPDNILLDSSTGRAMVTDFGIARALSDGQDSRLTATGMAIGTPAYMSPEQSAGERDVDGRTDLYSLGVVGYQMLTGEPPFTASSTPALLVKHLSERPVPVSDRRAGIPADLARAVMLMLEKDPANRFPAASALVAALDSGDVPQLPVRVEADAGARGGTLAPREPRSSGYPEAAREPSAEDVARWTAKPVQRFRKKITPYLFVNAVILMAWIFGGPNLIFVTVFWGIAIAYDYAKIWSDGYDWRDVFRQPRDRMLLDVAGDAVDNVSTISSAVFDKGKRAELRERNRSRRLAAGSTSPTTPASAADMAVLAGSHAGIVRQAFADRDEIARLVASMPQDERALIPDVNASASALAEKVQGLAVQLAEIERSAAAGALPPIEREIVELEAQANPLEHRRSEERVRRLAYLKRQRRAVADVSTRMEQLGGKLENCRIALQNMRLDVLRLRTGKQTYQHITLVAERAMSLAREVDNAVYVAEEMSRLDARGGGSQGRPSAGRR